MPRCLIVHATTEGQTSKIAAALAETLKERGLEVDVHEGPDPSATATGYDAVLVGGSIHAGSFQRGLVRWTEKHRSELNAIHNGFFGVCLTAASDEPDDRKEVQGYADRFMEQTGWKPDRVAMFAGALAFTRYGLIKRWLMTAIARKKTPDIDTSRDYELTDWEDVAAFAQHFADGLEHPRPVVVERT